MSPAPARRAAAVAALGLLLAACATSPGAGGGAPASRGPAASDAATSTATIAAPVSPQPADAATVGDIPDSQVFIPYTPPGATFEVAVPQGWARATDGQDVVFSDKLNAVRIHAEQRPAQPDAAQVRSQDVQAVQAAAPGFVLGDVQDVRRASGPVTLMTYTATSPPDPVTGRSVTDAVERYVFWRAGQAAVVTLTGPQGADDVDPWRKITDSFRWLA